MLSTPPQPKPKKTAAATAAAMVLLEGPASTTSANKKKAVACVTDAKVTVEAEEGEGKVLLAPQRQQLPE